MTFKEYREAFKKAVETAGYDYDNLIPKDINCNRSIAEYLPLEVLQAIVRHEVIEDCSVVINNTRVGQPVQWWPMWVGICEEEIIERLIMDKT